MLKRRKFLALQSTALLGLSLGSGFSFSKPRKADFTMCLNSGAIGVKANQQELLEYAITFGFDAIICLPEDIQKMNDQALKEYSTKMKEHQISWGSAGLTVDFRKSESKYQEGLRALPGVAHSIQKAGGTRMNTWIMPTHANLTYLENFKLHKKRIQEMSNILGHHGIRLGLEFVGPKTLMAREKYSFIRTMAEMKELIAAVNEDNVGFVLDSFHWYCSGGTTADILSLDTKDIVTVDLNDARSGIDADDQIDGKRELPGATGVIDLKSFLQSLNTLGYEGPIRAEPFNKVLNDMDNESALKTTYEAMKKSFSMI